MTKKILLKYIQIFKPMPELPTKKVFLNQYKKPITPNALEMVITRLRKKTGITRLHPHILRHTFATKYLIEGGDIFSLQQILGHTSLEMVRRYSHLASSYVIANHKKLSPLDNLQKRKHNFS
ncbi:MAG: tyrosine-type recombinase/integrase [Marinisporobacter sp.]|jgi:integrase/recombinase XerC/integrase/recombinase XerD|nr:tyrosine-type recombinase/integrase [Marinisporobacter sp.]